MSVESDAVELVGDETVENVARAAVFAALTGAFAYVSFPHPLTTVPITLQVLGVFLAGIFLGPIWGFASMGVYVAAGAVGAPIFAFGAAGAGVLFGKLGGYLVSYPIAAAVVGVVVHGIDGLVDPADVSLARLLAGMGLATVVIYALGTVGFAIAGDVGLVEAFLLAGAPFVPVELVKMAAAVGVVRSDAIAAE
ncbi:MAG: biotin transporter BioY [Halobacteriota archaeon]